MVFDDDDDEIDDHDGLVVVKLVILYNIFVGLMGYFIYSQTQSSCKC